MRRPFIAANWKMNKTISEAREYMLAFVPVVSGMGDRDIVIAPSFTCAFAVKELINGSDIALAGQNVFFEERGAFTGEISPLMLKEAGCEYVIIGHSERRLYFHETDEIVNKKIIASQKNGLKVIFCIGETLEEREQGKTWEVLERQITIGVKGADTGRLVIAYEPVWAIGTGKTATTRQAEEAHGFIRGRVGKFFNDNSIRILYGGSVTPENIDSLMSSHEIDGALVGGASLKPESFEKIVKFTRRIQ